MFSLPQDLPSSVLPQDEELYKKLLGLAKVIARYTQKLTRLSQDRGELPGWIKQEIGAEVAEFASIIVPNLHQKRDEVIYAKKHPEFIVSSATTGPDLLKHDGSAARELKTSRVGKGKRVNFSFHFPKKKTSESFSAYRVRVAKSFEDKTKNDGAVLRCLLHGRMIAEYFLSSQFLTEYVNRCKEETESINFGCLQCTKCGEFHRLQKLAAASSLLESGKKPDWTQIFTETPRNCKSPEVPAVKEAQEPTLGEVSAPITQKQKRRAPNFAPQIVPPPPAFSVSTMVPQGKEFGWYKNNGFKDLLKKSIFVPQSGPCENCDCRLVKFNGHKNSVVLILETGETKYLSLTCKISWR